MSTRVRPEIRLPARSGSAPVARMSGAKQVLGRTQGREPLAAVAAKGRTVDHVAQSVGLGSHTRSTSTRSRGCGPAHPARHETRTPQREATSSVPVRVGTPSNHPSGRVRCCPSLSVRIASTASGVIPSIPAASARLSPRPACRSDTARTSSGAPRCRTGGTGGRLSIAARRLRGTMYYSGTVNVHIDMP